MLAELPALPRAPAGSGVSVRAAHVVATVCFMLAAVLGVWFHELTGNE